MTSSTIRTSNPNCAQAFASLRLYGDDLVPEAISRVFGMPPTDAAERGDKKVSPSGKTRVAPTGRWILESEGQVAATELEPHIEWLLDRIEAAGIVPADLPGVTRVDICGFWVSATGHGGPVFSPELLGRLARNRLTLSLDIYSDAG
jgi:Domain of unknown function (DUF4279)